MKTFAKISLIFIGVLCVPLLLFSIFYNTPTVQNILKSSPLFSRSQLIQKTDNLDAFGYPIYIISFENGDGLTVDIPSDKILYGFTASNTDYTVTYFNSFATYKFYFKLDKENSYKTAFDSSVIRCFNKTLLQKSGLTEGQFALGDYISRGVVSGISHAVFFYCYQVVQTAGIYGYSTVTFSPNEWYRIAGVRPYVINKLAIPNVTSANSPFPYFRNCLSDDLLNNILPNTFPDNPIVFLYTTGQHLIEASTFFTDILTFNISGVSLFTVLFGGGFLIYVGWVVVKWLIPT